LLSCPPTLPPARRDRRRGPQHTPAGAEYNTRGVASDRAADRAADRATAMPLKEYRAKRNFTLSPEPQGDDREAERRAKNTKSRFFCVQKHLATALHYDFRLEHDGVLLSWAVPKGPSLNPSDKRLAMRVEDHPIEYGTFEGVIPDGYGAGVVMLWDQGTWTPEEDDVDGALAKGDLKFRLEGYKLKGSWVVVRTRGYGGRGSSRGAQGGQSWLLIKHRDDWAGPIDITTFAPMSVKSGGSFRDILQESPGVWESHRGASGSTNEAALAKIVQKVIALEEQEGGETRSPEPLPSTRARPRKTSVGKKAAKKEEAPVARKKPAAGGRKK
jgi:bifunctional non-homologous end joining protein LigD